jgi:hypothetical protein
MALDTPPLLRRKRRLGWNLEVTTGTAVAVAAANGVTPVFNPVLTLETETVDRESQGSLSPIVQGRGARSGRCTFETELFGGASSPDWTKLLRCCGFAEASNVFTPMDGATETLTMGLYQDGRLKRIAGCMGTFTLTIRRGQAARFAWDFRGVPSAPPSDTAMIAPTFVTTIAPRAGASVFTFGGSTYRVPEVSIELGNNVILREDITAVDTASEATGYRAAYITDRRPVVRFSPEASLLAAIDHYDRERDSTTGALAITIGGWAISCPALQLVNPPQDEDREGMHADALEFIATGSAGSELVLTHTPA